MKAQMFNTKLLIKFIISGEVIAIGLFLISPCFDLVSNVVNLLLTSFIKNGGPIFNNYILLYIFLFFCAILTGIIYGIILYSTYILIRKSKGDSPDRGPSL